MSCCESTIVLLSVQNSGICIILIIKRANIINSHPHDRCHTLSRMMVLCGSLDLVGPASFGPISHAPKNRICLVYLLNKIPSLLLRGGIYNREMLGLQQILYNICTTLLKRRRFEMISVKRRRSIKIYFFNP